MASPRRNHTWGNSTKPSAKSLLTIDQFLENVIGSQTLVATVANALSFRSFNLVTLGLVAMWALSPLGGQSALRLLHETNTTSTNPHSVFYANVDASSRLPIGGNNVDDFNRVNSVVSTSLMTASTLEWTPVDTWNHPKIPRVEELEQAENTNETHRTWYNLDRHANYSYASLTGVGVTNLSPVGSTNFTIPYEYMYFDCDLSPANNITTQFSEDGQNITSSNWLTQYKFLQTLNSAGRLDSANQFPSNLNSSIAPARPQNSYRDFFFYTINSEGSTFKPDALIYGSRQVGLTYYLFECSMKSVMVEANIVCEAASCGVERLRRLKVARTDRTGTALPYDIVNNAMYSRFFIQFLANIGGENGITQSNPVDAYINGLAPWSTLPESNVGPSKNWTEYVNDSNKAREMSHRLTRVMNTYWDSSRWPTSMTLNDPWGKALLNQTTGQPISPMLMNQTDVSTSSKNCQTHTESVQGNRLGRYSNLSCQRWMGGLSYHLLWRVTISRHFECVSVAPHRCARHLQSCLFLHAR
jgi:hypothetical protein